MSRSVVYEQKKCCVLGREEALNVEVVPDLRLSWSQCSCWEADDNLIEEGCRREMDTGPVCD